MKIENVVTITQPWSILIFLMTHWLLMTQSFNQYLPNDLILLSTLTDLPNPQMNQSISSSSASYQIFYCPYLQMKQSIHVPSFSLPCQTLHFFRLYIFFTVFSLWTFLTSTSLVNLPHQWYPHTRSFFATLLKSGGRLWKYLEALSWNLPFGNVTSRRLPVTPCVTPLKVCYFIL